MHPWNGRSSQGLTLTELLVATTLTVLVGAALFPVVGRSLASIRVGAAARLMVVRLQSLRSTSISRACTQGLLFQRDELGWFWLEVRDGNGNGLRTAELREGTDLVLSGPHRFSDVLPGVDLGFPADGRPIPRIPPRAGRLRDLERPVRFGKTGLVSFSPLGTSSSGTLYITDGFEGLIAVVLYGRTGRIRVWKHDFETGRWSR